MLWWWPLEFVSADITTPAVFKTHDFVHTVSAANGATGNGVLQFKKHSYNLFCIHHFNYSRR